MGIKQKVARNVAWNWAATATHMLAGFVIAPFLVQRLGETNYGLWILIASMTGYLSILDLGLRSALGRNIAFYLAKDDYEGANSVICTGLALLTGAAVAVVAVTFVARYLFFQLFEIPAADAANADLALILIGVNLALLFPANVFECILWAHQRFDLQNLVDIPAVLLRAALTFALTGTDSNSLVTLGWIHVGVTLFMAAGMVAGTLYVHRPLRLRWQLVRWSTITHLFSFGVWCFLMTVAHILSKYLGPYLIGNRLGVLFVTPYSFAARLVGYVHTILITGTGVLTPVATTFHAQEKRGHLHGLFMFGGRACMALALFFFGGFLFLGDAFLRLWTGKELENAYTLLLILMAGELLPLSQWVTYSTVIGMDRHRLWATMSMLEVVLILVLSFVFLSWEYSVISLTLAMAIPAAICRGLVQMIYGCRILEIPLHIYLRRAFAPAALAAVLPIGLLGLACSWHEPQSWWELLAFAGGYSIIYVVTGLAAFYEYLPLRLTATPHAPVSNAPDPVEPALNEPAPLNS